MLLEDSKTLELEEKLKSQLLEVNAWLKYAEEKNAVMVALCSGVIWGFLDIFKDNLSFNNISVFSFSYFSLLYRYEFIICILISLIIALISFYPQTENSFFNFSKKEKNSKDNLLFYGVIAKYSISEILEFWKPSNNYTFTDIEKKYAEQIIENSKITCRKNQYFKDALFFVLSSILTFPIAFFIMFIFNPKYN